MHYVIIRISNNHEIIYLCSYQWIWAGAFSWSKQLYWRHIRCNFFFTVQFLCLGPVCFFLMYGLLHFLSVAINRPAFAEVCFVLRLTLNWKWKKQGGFMFTKEGHFPHYIYNLFLYINLVKLFVFQHESVLAQISPTAKESNSKLQHMCNKKRC